MAKRKVLTIIGTRPQFIKAALVSGIIRKQFKEVLLDTGQHYDYRMSGVFFDDFKLPKPDYNLRIAVEGHGQQVGRMLMGIEKVLLREEPALVIVYGDTNSTLAGALAAVKLKIPVAHIEAGLRSYDFGMSEDINRTVVDHVSSILFCPTKNAVLNLHKEGMRKNVFLVGDVMYDVARHYADFARKPFFRIPEKFALVTMHRAENTDNINRLKTIWCALNKISEEIGLVFPLHPRTRKALAVNKIKSNFQLFDPVSYLEMSYLLKRCSIVLTDSGGLQKEAFFFKKPCVIIRNETEWSELVRMGFAQLSGAGSKEIYSCYARMIQKKIKCGHYLYGDGRASQRIVKVLARII